MIPQVDDVKELRRITLQEWLRVYLNYLWRWLGGKGSLPWKKLKGTAQAEYLDPSCLPKGMTTLQDPHRMTRDHLESLYLHILTGQLGQLPESQILQFRHVDVTGSTSPLVYESLCHDQPRLSRVKYSPNKKLYALRVSQGLDEPSPKPSWNGLPLAQLYALYVPFDNRTKDKLIQMSWEEHPFAQILELLDEMETLGPVHTFDQSPSEVLNAHFPENLDTVDIRKLIGSKLLPPTFFNGNDPEHDAVAFPTLIVWLRCPNCFVHALSGTLHGGSKGFQWVVAVAARILATLTIARHPHELPTNMCRVITPSALEQSSLQLQRLCAWLVSQLVHTNSVLRSTFSDHSKAWKQAVVSAHLKNSLFNSSNSTPVLLHTTSGVPLDATELHECYDAVMESDPDCTLGSANDIDPAPPHQPAMVRPRVTHTRPRWTPNSSDDSDNGEYIEIPEDDLDSMAIEDD
ncbi:hypothetical protein FRC08_001894 [Ceratobasidium sp. 394]|nr:hypothetical protein FRC08_001894 [Ceratobasidium sp. 394]